MREGKREEVQDGKKKGRIERKQKQKKAMKEIKKTYQNSISTQCK